MAKRNSRKMTANQREYAKQLKRIKQAVRRAEKRGYMFEDNVVPQTPKRITKKSIQALKEITPEKLYAKAEYLDTSTGEVLSGQQGRKLEREKSALKAKQTRERKRAGSSPYQPSERQHYPSFSHMVINNYKAHIRQFNDVAYEKLSEWLERLIGAYGEDDVAIMLNEGAENGLIVTYQIVYSQDKMTQYIAEMINYLPEAGEFQKQEIVDAFEGMEDWESPV